jgi:hypothetical protein
MKEFDEAQSTNEYLTGKLILARKQTSMTTVLEAAHCKNC